MTRRPFIFFSRLSLLLCIGTVALWIRSNWRHDHAALLFRHSLLSVESNMGIVAFVRGTSVEDNPQPDHRLDWASSDASFDLIWFPLTHGPFSHECQGFESRRGRASIEFWTTPYWFWTLLTVVFPLTMIAWNRVSRRRGNEGYCRCGYDLRASKGRCPECGTPIATKTETAA